MDVHRFRRIMHNMCVCVSNCVLFYRYSNKIQVMYHITPIISAFTSFCVWERDLFISLVCVSMLIYKCMRTVYMTNITWNVLRYNISINGVSMFSYTPGICKIVQDAVCQFFAHIKWQSIMTRIEPVTSKRIGLCQRHINIPHIERLSAYASILLPNSNRYVQQYILFYVLEQFNSSVLIWLAQ